MFEPDHDRYPDDDVDVSAELADAIRPTATPSCSCPSYWAQDPRCRLHAPCTCGPDPLHDPAHDCLLHPPF